MLAEYNPMLVHVYSIRLHNACATTQPKCATGDDCGLSGGGFTQKVMIASYLATRLLNALTGALCKGQGAFTTAKY